MRSLSPRVTATFAAALLVLSACTGDDPGEGSADEEPRAAAADAELRVSVASFDLHTGEDQRLLLGVATADQGLLAFGDIEVELGPVGDDPENVELTQQATASYLPVPGDAPEGGGSQPSVLVGQSGTGVYEAFVDLDEPGFWAVQVTAELDDGTTRTGTASFPQQQPGGIGEEPEVPAVGDEAPLTRNLTVDDVDGGDVRAAMVDSRAGDDDEVPDSHIHDSTIADGIEDGRPVVALFATPVYCVSRFCGPITETFADLAEEYGDRADFVHVEIWEDFDSQALNDAAAEWIQTEQGGNEPWTFLIDEHGRIAARWDNVLDVDALTDELERLPAMTHTEGDDGE
jgi:hypothetical protein